MHFSHRVVTCPLKVNLKLCFSSRSDGGGHALFILLWQPVFGEGNTVTWSTFLAPFLLSGQGLFSYIWARPPLLLKIAVHSSTSHPAMRSFVHAANRHLLSTYYVPGAVWEPAEMLFTKLSAFMWLIPAYPKTHFTVSVWWERVSGEPCQTSRRFSTNMVFFFTPLLFT